MRGQYRGYVDEDGRATPAPTSRPSSPLRFEIDSWRWAGVPWLIRAGKCLPATATEAVVEFAGRRGCSSPPPAAAAPEPNHLRFRLGKDDGIILQVQAKAPGDELVTRPVNLEVSLRRGVRPPAEAYQRLLEDAIEGDHRRFGRADAIEEQWRIVEPVLADPTAVQLYDKGTWGPPRPRP